MRTNAKSQEHLPNELRNSVPYRIVDVFHSHESPSGLLFAGASLSMSIHSPAQDSRRALARWLTEQCLPIQVLLAI